MSYPFIFTTKESTIEMKAKKCQHLFNCDHEEADTRLVLHVILANQDIIVDVLIFLVWAYANFNIRCKRFAKYDSENYADIETICGFLRQALSLVLRSFHALNGCDTTSRLHQNPNQL